MAGGTRDRWNLFLCSFTILFVELVCIRWIPAYIRYLGYFTNFVLLGSFLGIGLGILQARRRLDLQTFFPLALAVLVWVVSTFKLQLTINTSQEVFNGLTERITVQGTESFFLLPLGFGVVRVLNAAILLAVVVGVSVLGRSSFWSPYYRIDVQPRSSGGYALFVNNI